MTEIRPVEEISFSANDAQLFLLSLWGREGWGELRLICRDRVIVKWFKTPEEVNEAIKWLSRNWPRIRGCNVFYGVLVRDEKPEKGGGKTEHVREACWLFADLDYKQEIPRDKVPQDVLGELESRGVVAREEQGHTVFYARAESTYYKIVVPRPEEVLELAEKLLGKPAYIVRSGYGYHVYWGLDRCIPVEEWRPLQEKLVEVLGADKKSKDPARILRVPGTWNCRFGECVPVEIVHEDIAVLPVEEAKKKLLETQPRPTEAVEEVDEIGAEIKRRDVDGDTIEKIVSIIKEYWRPGYRDALEMGLIGWMYKAGFSKESARRVIERIVEVTNDEERDKRLYEFERQWAKGEKGEELIGKTNIIEVISQQLQEKGLSGDDARDEALRIVTELEQYIAPQKRLLIRTPLETNTYIVNDPVRGIVVLKEKRRDNQVVRKRLYISDWFLERVEVTRAEGGLYIYAVGFRNIRTGETWTWAGDVEEIALALSKIHGVKRANYLKDALSALISEFMRRGMAEVRETAAASGFEYRDRLVFVKDAALSKVLVPDNPDPEKAKRALELLARLREYYSKEKFDAAMNWVGYAPLGYVLKKQYHIKQFYLFLHGFKQTGKTTLARIITSLFPVVTSFEEDIPEEGQSEYRLAWKLSLTSLPIVEDEVEGIRNKRGLIGLLKRAATGLRVRWRGDTKRVYTARAALVMTSNYTEPLEDEALAERLIVIYFGKADHVGNKPKKAREEFKKLYNEYRLVANHLGRVLIDTILESWPEIEEVVHTLNEREDYLALGRMIWKRVCARLGAECPWTETQGIPDQEEETDWRDLVRMYVVEVVREIAARNKEPIASMKISDMLVKYSNDKELPAWMTVKGEELLLWGAPFLRDFEKRLGVAIPNGLKDLAERAGFEYKVRRVAGRNRKVMVVPLAFFDEE